MTDFWKPLSSDPGGGRYRRQAPVLPRVAWCTGLWLALAIVATVHWTAAAAEARVALVIGNGGYLNFRPLENPANDAADVATALKGLGFEVLHGTDLDHSAMIDLVGRFVRAAHDADVVLFYYAGHGFQIDQQNYLVPVDAAIRLPDDIAGATIRLDEITSELRGGDGVRLIFLDACRNNPLPPGVSPEPLRSGLAQVGDAAGFLFAFATQPDNVAYDGVGRNSFFTRALLGHVGTPGQDIATTMIEVRKDVIAATGGRQVPWENSSLTRQFAFVPGDPPPTADTMLWQVAAAAEDPRLLEIYLDRYPVGAHQADAAKMLAGLASPAPESEGSARREIPATSPTVADALWDVARRSRTRPLVEAYLAHAPDGSHAAEARDLLAVLPSSDDQATVGPEQRCEALATYPEDATATVAGVPLARLAKNAAAAVAACSAAAAARPELPHYTTLLARATFVSGDPGRAIDLYRDAAARGDVRAMFILARRLQTGDNLEKNIPAAVALYEKAAAGGNADAAINLAVLLTQGPPEMRDPDRAVDLLQLAAEGGSGTATYNLGVLARRGGRSEEALEDFRKAATLGESRAYVPAAIMLDEGGGVPRDPAGAADLLLRGVASDYGEAYGQLTGNASQWRPETIRAVQGRLQAEGLYTGAIDGVSGPKLAAALGAWRRGGRLIGQD